MKNLEQKLIADVEQKRADMRAFLRAHPERAADVLKADNWLRRLKADFTLKKDVSS